MIKKICVVNNDLTYFNLHRKKFINIIDKNSNHITLLFPSSFKRPQFDKNIKDLKKEGYRVDFFFLKRKSLNVFLEILTLITLMVKVSNKYDLIYSSTIKLNLYLILFNIFKKYKIILHFSGLGFFYVNHNYIIKIFRIIIEKTFKFFKNNYTYCIFENLDDSKYFINIKKIFKPESCLNIDGVGVNIKKFHITKKNDKQFNILMISRITLEKGVNEFLDCYESFINNEDFKFYLIGPYEKNRKNKKLKNKIDLFKENKNFEYHEWITDVKIFYDLAHVAILPSYREGLSVFLLEALASGLPIICTNVTGNKTLVKNNYNGYLVNLNSSNEIKNSINMLRDNKTTYKTYSINSRKLSEEIYDENIIIKKFEKFIIKNKII